MKRKTPLRAKKGLKRTGFKVVKTKPARRQKQPSMRLLKNKLWAECKRIIRARFSNSDGTFTCYTCGKHLDVPAKAQTGHFIPSSVCSVEMRYSLDNLRIQCYRCNINLSGNWIEYEKRLQRDGVDTDQLKQQNEQWKNLQYDSLWYQNKIDEYKAVEK